MLDLELIRHASVFRACQYPGIGSALLFHFRGLTTRRMLIGKWLLPNGRSAFYRRRGFELVPPDRAISMALGPFFGLARAALTASVRFARACR